MKGNDDANCNLDGDGDRDKSLNTGTNKSLIDVYLGASHDGVPITLLRAFPGLNAKGYSIKKTNPIWLYSLVKICSNCW